MIEVVSRVHNKTEVWLLDPDGSARCVHVGHNLIVNSGKDLLARLAGEDLALGSPLRAVALGTGSTAVNTGQTALVTEFSRKAVPAFGTNNGTIPRSKNVLSSSVLTIGESFGPGINGNTFHEVGIFGGIVELTNPTTAPVCTPSSSGGSLATGTYTVSYSWKNANGETQEVVTTGVSVTGPNGSIAVTVPTKPAGATHSRIYAAIGGSRLRITDITGTTFTITTLSGSSGSPSGSNTTLRPGIAGSGLLYARFLIAQPGGVNPSAGQYVYVEDQMDFL